MTRALALVRWLPAIVASIALGASAAAQSDRPLVIELQVDGQIDPVSAEYVIEGLDQADASGAALVLITLHTPGGLDTSMRAIIQRILDSRSPVAVYVTPSGARAASAGFFILLAADVAAMGTGTHTGAASPLAAVGGVPVQIDETLRNKILNDATAYLRSYAERRGRNVELAETAVTEGKAFTEREALEGSLIDLVADSQAALLEQLDGREISRFDGRTTTLELTDARVESIAMTARQRFLSRIVQPDMFFILLIVGILGLYTEFTHPGLFAPGVIGGICLVLALFAMHVLPINFAAVLLIALALALFILEANFPSHGILGAGGAAAMLLGAFMLVRSPITGAGVSLGVALGATVPFALLTIALMRLVLRSRAWPVQTGLEDMIGQIGLVTESVPGDGVTAGLVHVRGELWRAVSRAPISTGLRARVVAAEGLTLQVEPVSD